MEEEKLSINILNDGATEVVIRHGEALPLREVIKLAIEGNIDTVRLFLAGRISTLDPLKCNIMVSRDGSNPGIKLAVNETDPFSGVIVGKMIINKDFVAFGINTGKKYTLRDLSDFIKMHRYCFDDTGVAMKLVADLRNFKAKVNKEIEKLGDNRGNKNEVLSQVVDTNIPESFTLSMPIFKSGPMVKFKVDINIIVRDSDMDCQLESVEANDLIELFKSETIDRELDLIKEIAPGIIRIEV